MRGNSLGIKNKNLIKVNNKYLMEYTINHAINSNLFNKIVISSDSERILRISKKFKVDFIIKRPSRLATKDISKHQAIIHAVKKTEKKFNEKYDYVFDLDICSPLRNTSDIKNSFNLMMKNKSPNLISVCHSKRNPYFNMVEYKDNKLSLCKEIKKKIFSRQKAPKVYDMNSSIYIWKKFFLFKYASTINQKTAIYIMPQKRSYDLDEMDDIDIIKFYLKKNEPKK
jgi:CMP-N-acetylneuraminic acid synthetase